ncbi:ribosome recycling factor domain-containing protein [Lasiosphaeris hirsuta]|uniref:Ribosome recycling factor domain-containing protein n=1 Tax=Lasiosphaeris hirsuta TaxID=260670 RepID=A0AA40BBH7_9PEZI|nr:ribosome recycling factor domain-containing protein [Lasiosphaeris hirsuta]
MKGARAANVLLHSNSYARSICSRTAMALPFPNALATSRHQFVSGRIASSGPTLGHASGANSGVRFFSVTQTVEKKNAGKKGQKEDTKPAKASSSSSAADSTDGSGADPENPTVFNDVTEQFQKAQAHTEEQVAQLLSGGRFNAKVIGALPVQPDRKSTQVYPLRELATVSPLGGRRFSILAFEESSIKPILSAVQKSDDFNQQPQRNEENPLELTLTVEPERADALIKRAKDLYHTWRELLREETHKRNKLHAKWQADGTITVDVSKNCRTKLQVLQTKYMDAINKAEKNTLRQIESKLG